MYIGKPHHVFTVEPLEEPVPQPVEAQRAAKHVSGRKAGTVDKPSGASGADTTVPSRSLRRTASRAADVA